MQYKRIIDVNINRLFESLRIIEDIERFIYNDRNLTQRIKSLRHKLKEIPYKEFISARNIKEDFGKEPAFDISEKKNIKEVLCANLIRAKESARVLEEFSHIHNRALTSLFKSIRFELYEIEKEILLYVARQEVNYRLYAIVGDYLHNRKIEDVITALIKGGVTIIQLRLKDVSTREFINIAQKVHKITKKFNVPLIINDRWI